MVFIVKRLLSKSAACSGDMAVEVTQPIVYVYFVGNVSVGNIPNVLWVFPCTHNHHDWPDD